MIHRSSWSAREILAPSCSVHVWMISTAAAARVWRHSSRTLPASQLRSCALAMARHARTNSATGSGLSASGDVRTIHLVNARTVDALAAAAGVALDPGRFRANVILDGLEPWAEFSWVGRHFQLGSARLNCIKRTVRCAGVNVDARTGSGRADLDIPALLTRHFPQHGPYLGVYAQVVSAGEVRIGDRARVESATEGTPYGG